MAKQCSHGYEFSRKHVFVPDWTAGGSCKHRSGEGLPLPESGEPSCCGRKHCHTGKKPSKARPRCNATLNDPAIGVPVTIKARRKLRCPRPSAKGSVLCSGHRKVADEGKAVWSAHFHGAYGPSLMGRRAILRRIK